MTVYKVRNYEFKKVSDNDVEDMLTWKYEGIYSFFDNDFSKGKINYIKSFPADNNVYAIYNEENMLVGNCALYLNDKVTFSIQMRPSLTSKGMGKEFLEAILAFVKEKYKLKNIGLSVLKFNERAIRLYKSLDFKVVNEFIGKTVKGEMEFITMEKEL
ncbi:GNAT family N-acetyltransferase [Clostridium sp.]|uniref:GNAT family N-acetyltransferase n=1 Tax=Clostridium sp. TaxID=1506 RepID=UPI00321636E0